MGRKSIGLGVGPCAAALVCLASVLVDRVQAQVGFSNQFDLSSAVQLEEVDGAARMHLERVKAFIEEKQWDDAVETLRNVMETHGDRVIAVVPGRYITIRDYCQLQIAGMPPEALALYQQRVDPLAQSWFVEGVENRDAAQLQRVVDQVFTSSYGDDALLMLGELALEQGKPGEARRNWEQISPLLKTTGASDGRALWSVLRDVEIEEVWDKLHPLFTRCEQLPSWLVYLNTDLDLAAVRARLVLASLVEGNLPRAKVELELLRRLHPEARGRLGGKEVNFAERLAELLKAAETWSEPSAVRDWPTFAGSNQRQVRTASISRPAVLAWDKPIELGPPPQADGGQGRASRLGAGSRRVAEDVERLLSYHPIVVGNLLLVADQQRVSAYHLATGKSAWQEGTLFQDRLLDFGHHLHDSRIGVPRFTLSSSGTKVFARMGPQTTSWPSEFSAAISPGSLVCLDLEHEGALMWKVEPDGARWSFEGTPICDGAYVYVAMRRNDVRPQAHVACFDARTGNRLWRQYICAAETPGRGQVEEITHNMLTLAEDTLYFNTNLGAVAALQASTGQVRWITLYPRAKQGDLAKQAAHFYRDLNPCIYYQGTVLVAPSDCELVLALDADTGQTVWSNNRPEDVVHLLGVSQGRLLASGDRLWWLDVESGKVIHRWPESATSGPRGFGRGAIAGREVYFPTRDRIYIFDCETAEATQEPFMLGTAGIEGGNLVIVDGYLLIAGTNTLQAFSHAPPAVGAGQDNVTLREAQPELQRVSRAAPSASQESNHARKQ